MAKTRARNKKGHFVKGGGTKALVRTRTKHVTKWRTRSQPKRKVSRRRGRGGGSGGVTAAKLAIAGIGLGALVGSQNMAPKSITDQVDKLPGVKTFGRVAVVGLGLGAIGKYTRLGGRFSPWLRAAGAVGLVAAAIKLGTDNTGFKFIGDDYDDDEIADVEG